MTSKEMRRTECPKGYWFVNVAKIGRKPNWQLKPLPNAPKVRRVPSVTGAECER